MKDQDPDRFQTFDLSEKIPPALKHGAFSTLTVLPGEDKSEFEALHKSLVAELAPDGPLETHAVKAIAESIWRASHLTIFQRAKWARLKYTHPLPVPPEIEFNVKEHLEKELAILERLDTRITRATKMLMQAKAMKEIMGTGSNNKAKIHAVGQSAEGCKLK